MRLLCKLFFCVVVIVSHCFSDAGQAAVPQVQSINNTQAGMQSSAIAPSQANAPQSAARAQNQPTDKNVAAPAIAITTSAATPAAPVATAQSVSADADQGEVTGIDTADLNEPQGNWLFKRMWWQRAESQYEKIKTLVETIMESRLAFFAKRTEWDKTIFDPFYMDIGVGRGVLDELIANAIAQMTAERTKEGELNQEERELLAAFETEKSALEQLQKDIQKINTIDGAIDDAITMLINQVNSARNFEKQSWQNLKNIAQEVSDKNARDLYYGMATYWQNINDVATYIQGPFDQYFETLGSSAKDQIAKVNDSLKALKEKGIDFKKHWQDLQEKHQLDRDANEYHEGLQAAQQEQHKEEVTEKKEVGFITRIFHAIGNAISTTIEFVSSGFKSAWDFTIGRLFKKTEPAQVTNAPVLSKEAEHTKD